MSSKTKLTSLIERFASYALSLCLIGVMSTQAFGWGDKGHRIVARIAARNLTDQARDVISDLIRGDPFIETCVERDIPTRKFADRFACLATWADKAREDRPYTGEWHFVDIPRNTDQYVVGRDCLMSNQGDCVLNAITRFAFILANPQTADHPKAEEQAVRAEALKFIIHFIGDMHQPLHAATDTEDQEAIASGTATDRGGNLKFVTWLGKAMNDFGDNWQLHAVWDTGIIEASTKDEVAFANSLAGTLSDSEKAFTKISPPGTKPNWNDSLMKTLVQWAEDSHKLARQQAYGQLGPQDMNDVATDKKGHKFHRYHLTDAYLKANRPVIEQQLKLAGIRLARVLNEAFR
jgi:hypothetical protein